MSKRCEWCGTDPLYVGYHDEEWGVPVYDSKALFAKLILDGAQAGLSWITILRKRENYYAAFDGLDPDKMAYYDEAKILELLGNAGIVRNKLKVRSAVTNAQAFLRMRDEEGLDFAQFVWDFVGGKPVQNEWASMGALPAETERSRALSKALKKRGFKFVGPTIVYAWMQAVGMVNDHVVGCFRYEEVKRMTK
ncbi:MAG TPA: DNA-3-methyladenine glycosylase I [Anaerolineae bacterium]|nr:DNA-3-methyladenine glycosylase I [Anaerolineae bacterium]